MRLPAARSRYDEEDERQTRRILEQEVTRLKAAIDLCLLRTGGTVTGALVVGTDPGGTDPLRVGGQVTSGGDGGGYAFNDRATGAADVWVWYATGGIARLWKGADKVTVDASGNLLMSGHLGVGNSAAATTPGSVVKKIEIFDSAGASLGYLAVYSSIT